MSRPGELETDPISLSAVGAPIQIDSVTATAADPLHVMTVTDAL